MKNLVALSFPVLIVAATVSAQQPAPLPETNPAFQPPVFRSAASLVSVSVTVTDGKRFVTGLQPGDFAVYEDGVRQQVQFFEATSVPLDLVLLIDTSSSMRDKMEVVHEAALGFIKTLRRGDRGAVVEFNDSVNIGQELTADLGAIETAIKATGARGGTALNNALYISLKQFGPAARAARDVRRQVIAVLSDGQDTASVVTFEDVLGQARKGGVNVYAIGLKSPSQGTGPDGRRYFSESDYALKAIAQETGAQAFFPTQIGELKGIYGAIAQELSSQYSIGYAPTNTRADGRYRRITVQLISRPELKLRARAGYLAEQAVSRASGSAYRPGR